MDPTAEANHSRGSECDELVCAIDLIPTFVDWAGGEPQWHWLEGRSLLPVLQQSSTDQGAHFDRDCVVSECDYGVMNFAKDLGRDRYNARMTMVFDGRYKYVHCLGFKPMLFDVQEDPQERADLGRDAGYAGIRSQLGEQLLDWSAGLKNRVTVSKKKFDNQLDKAGEVGILIGYWQADDVPQALQLQPEVPLT